MHKSGIFAVLLFILIPGLAFSVDPGPKYLKVKPSKGMGAYGLLRTYQLLNRTENLQKFYEINKLKPGSALQSDQSYYLPLKTMRFDGKSIRTSAHLNDYSQAKELQIYNEAMVEAKLKSKSFIKDKILWVPEEFFNNDSEKGLAINKSESNSKMNRSPLSNTKRDLIADSRLLNTENSEDIETEIGSKTKIDSQSTNVRKVSNRMLSVSLFGPNNSQVPVESDELSNQVFYIVPGHGGPDPGAMYKDKDSEFTFCEDEYAYDVSLRLARNLITKGAYVYVIVQDKNDGIRDERYLECDKDEECIGGHEMPINQLKRLRQEMIKTNQIYLKEKLNGIKQQWMVSIHIDSQPEENRQDVFFYYQSESKESKKKAKELKNVFTEKYKKYQNRDYNGSISARPLYVMRTSEADPIFIELANINNSDDRERIASPRNRQLLADWIMEGFL